MITIGVAQLWVHDQDEALDFYTKKVGLEVRNDVTLPELGNFRWLTVGPVGQPDVSIALLTVPAKPLAIRLRTWLATSSSITGGPGMAISTIATSGCPAGLTVSQRKSPSSGSVASVRTSKPSFSV